MSFLGKLYTILPILLHGDVHIKDPLQYLLDAKPKSILFQFSHTAMLLNGNDWMHKGHCPVQREPNSRGLLRIFVDYADSVPGEGHPLVQEKLEHW